MVGGMLSSHRKLHTPVSRSCCTHSPHLDLMHSERAPTLISTVSNGFRLKIINKMMTDFENVFLSKQECQYFNF